MSFLSSASGSAAACGSGVAAGFKGDARDVESRVLKAGPGLLLQSNTVADGTPMMTSDSALVTLTDDWLNS